MQFDGRSIEGHCSHAAVDGMKYLALITIGNSLRGDDGVAAALCDSLPKSFLTGVCRFDLGTHTALLGSCLRGHDAAIIIDSTNNGTAPGTVSILDLTTIIQRNRPLNIKACHGLSLADELRLAAKEGPLPKRLIFFGVEIGDASWSDELSSDLETSLPSLSKKLSPLVGTMLETLKRSA